MVQEEGHWLLYGEFFSSVMQEGGLHGECSTNAPGEDCLTTRQQVLYCIVCFIDCTSKIVQNHTYYKITFSPKQSN